MIKLEKMRISRRLLLAGLAVLAGLIMLALNTANRTRSELLELHRHRLSSLVETAASVVTYFRTLESEKKLAHADAQRQAIDALRTLRFSGGDYFFLYNFDGRALMVAGQPAIEGQIMLGRTDVKGNKLWDAFVAIGKGQGAGFVEYWFPRFGQTEPRPKLSYVKSIPEWQWIIGTGVYMEDVDIAVRKAVVHNVLISSLILLAVAVAAWFISRSIVQQLGGEPSEAIELLSRAAQGDLTIEFNSSSRGSILASVDTMIRSIRDMQSRIMRQEREFRTLAENSPDAIVRYDREGHRLYINPAFAEMINVTSGEYWAETPAQYASQPVVMEFKKRVGSVFEHGRMDEGEYTWQAHDGRILTTHVRFVPERDPSGVIASVLCVGRDITESKRLEKELLKTEKLESLGVLAGGIAHDFNNMLMVIMGHIALAKELSTTDEGTDGSLDVATEACRHAMELARRLITFAKGGEPVRKPVAIVPMLRNCLSLHGRGMTVELSAGAGIGMVNGDEGQLQQVFDNLIINAAQAMPDGGRLQVSAYDTMVKQNERSGLAPGNYVRIVFRDEGCGIAHEVLPRIFDPYFTTKPNGSGIGLASSNSIINRHEGKIFVTSLPGAGATFTLFLPSRHDPVSAGPAQPAPQQKRPSSSTVLIMDDELVIRRLMEILISRIGYRPIVAADGAEAVALYRNAMQDGSPFAAVIMDLTVPNGMGGKEAAQQILELDPDARLIAASGYSNDPVMARPREYGFKEALAKPYTVKQLKAALDAACT